MVFDSDFLSLKKQIRQMEKDPALWRDTLADADLILFCYPVYTFLVPAQLHRFIELVKESGISLRGKYATQISTSKHFYDVTAHRFIKDNCGDLGFKYVRGLSADMDDLLHARGREEALAFFRYVLWSMRNGHSEPAAAVRAPAIPAEIHPEAEKLACAAPKRIVIAADLSRSPEGRLLAMCQRLQNRLPCEARAIAYCEIIK